MKKRLVSLLTALAMIVSLFSSAAALFPQTVVADDENPTKIVVDNDGTSSATNAKFDEYFATTAEEGVAALLDAGKIYVNGIQVPAEEPTQENYEYQVDWVKSLYKTDTGWGYNVHKTTSANNLSFEAARKGFFDTITQVRGHQMTFYLDAEGICEAINVESFEVVRIANIEEWGHDRVIDRGDFELETNRIRYDANLIHFDTTLFDPNVAIGDIAVYWYGSEELGGEGRWHLVKATPMEGKISKSSNGWYVVNAGEADEWTQIESNVSRYNLIESSRPTQGFNAYKRVGLQDEKIVLWNTPNGYPIGFTFGSTPAASRANLKKAIANAETHVAEIKVSEDGSDIPKNELWTTQDAVDTFNAAIEAAKTVANKNSSSHMEIDFALYTLGNAWGEGGARPTGFDGELAYGEAAVLETVVFDHDGSTTISDAKYDEYFEGTAAEGVQALLNAGKVSINGIPVPATESETNDYQINLVDSLYKTSTGWGYNVHKTTSANNLGFEEARTGMVNTTSTVRGHKTTLSLADGICVGINMESFETMKIVYFEDHGGTVDKIDRGDFELETSRVRYDGNNVTVSSANGNFDTNIQFGDVVVYWYSTDGWHMVKANSKVGTLHKEDGKYTVNKGKEDEWTQIESNVSRYNLINDTRPTQCYNAYVRVGLQDAGYDIITWSTPNDYPIGFSYGSNAKAALKKAIENAEALVASVTASEDGSDVPSNRQWAPQSAIDDFNAAISAAKTINNRNSSASWNRDAAIYALSEAWGQGGSRPSGFVGEVGYGSADPVYEYVTFDHDGSTTISDAKYDEYFEGTAAEGVQALLNAGKVSINGIAVPATEDETDAFQINMVDSLYKTETGWGYNVHKTTSANNLAFEEARTGMVNTTSTVRGHVTTLTIDNGACVAINMESFETMKLVGFEIAGGQVSGIDRGDFQLETSRVRYDANNITLPEANFDETIEKGDVVVYWYSTDGWHMVKADKKVGTLHKADGKYTVNKGKDDEWTQIESNVSRYNLIDNSRPTQCYNAYVRLGLQDAGYDIITWSTPNEYPIGFSYGENARAALELAVENAEALLASVKVSEDGTDVPSNRQWAPKEAVDTFKAAIEEAKAVLADESAESWDIEIAIYALSGAWGEGGSRPSGFVGELGYGEGEIVYELLTTIVINMGEDKTAADAKYDDLYEEGNALQGIIALIKEGKVCINGFAIPATAEEFEANGFTVDDAEWMTKVEGGYKVDRNTYEDYDIAAAALLGRVSNGNEIQLFDCDEDGKVDAINALYVEAMIADSITSEGGVYTVTRSVVDDSLVFEGKDGRVYDGSKDVLEVEEANWDATIQEGDMIFFKKTPAGWVAERAREANGILTDGADHQYYQIDDVKYGDAMRFSRDNIIISNRCGELVNAHKYFGFMNNDEGLKVSLWLVNTTDPAKQGAPAGFTTAGNASTFLQKAIAAAEAKLEGVVESADGAGLATGTKWATAENIADLQAAITRAKGVLGSDAADSLKDYMVYLLYFALHGSSEDIGARFAGFNYEGFDNQINEVTAIDISEAVVTFNGIEVTKAGQYWAAYDGAEKKPEVVVTLGGQTLTADDYDVEYAGNKNVGTATVTVTGKGGYTGSAAGSFMITFKDVPATHNFQKAVYWAVENSIAAGYSGAKKGTFGVGDNCTRGQVVMFLWRAAGQPKAKDLTTQSFTDVKTTHNFYKAIQWAVEKGITAGYSDGTFRPNADCTRGQIAMFLWRYAGKPKPASTEQRFSDVKPSNGFFTAIQWAAEQKITAGYSDGTFGVNKPCTRGHCVTFLYRLIGE